MKRTDHFTSYRLRPIAYSNFTYSDPIQLILSANEGNLRLSNLQINLLFKVTYGTIFSTFWHNFKISTMPPSLAERLGTNVFRKVWLIALDNLFQNFFLGFLFESEYLIFKMGRGGQGVMKISSKRSKLLTLRIYHKVTSLKTTPHPKPQVWTQSHFRGWTLEPIIKTLKMAPWKTRNWNIRTWK